MDNSLYGRQVRENLPEPGTTPVEHLRHTVAAHVRTADDDLMVMATMGIYEAPTGLTMGNLRKLLVMLDGLDK